MSSNTNACVFVVIDNADNHLGLPVNGELIGDAGAMRDRIVAQMERDMRIVVVMSETEAQLMLTIHAEAMNKALEDGTAERIIARKRGYH